MGSAYSNIKIFTNNNRILSKNKYCVTINKIKMIYADSKLVDVISDFLEQHSDVIKTQNINDIILTREIYDTTIISLDDSLSNHNNETFYVRSKNETILIEINITLYSKHQDNIVHNIKVNNKLIGSNLSVMGALYHTLGQQIFTHCKHNKKIIDLSSDIASYVGQNIIVYQNIKKVITLSIEQINDNKPSIVSLDGTKKILHIYNGYGDVKEKKYTDHTFHRILFKQLPYNIYIDKLYEISIDNVIIDNDKKLTDYEHFTDKKIHVKYNNIILLELCFTILSTSDKLYCRLYKSDSTSYISSLISSPNNTLFDIIYSLINENYVNLIECHNETSKNSSVITLYDNISQYDGETIGLYLNDILVYVLKIGNQNKHIPKFGIEL